MNLKFLVLLAPKKFGMPSLMAHGNQHSPALSFGTMLRKTLLLMRMVPRILASMMSRPIHVFPAIPLFKRRMT
jgi:hypothetical protein